MCIKNKKINIKNSNNKITTKTEEQLKEYIDIREIVNYNYKNNIELVISSRWKFDEKSNISRVNYHYINKNPNITLNDIEKFITLFKQGKIEEIINNHNIDLQYDYKEYINDNKISDTYNYSAVFRRQNPKPNRPHSR